MRINLTKRLVATAQPRERPYEIRDLAMKGLILRVQPSGYKAWIVEWARGKRKTLGFAGHLTLDEARAQTLQAMAQALQDKLPDIAGKTVTSPTLRDFLAQRYEPWAIEELRGGARYVERIRVTFPGFLDQPLSAIDHESIEDWWRARVHTRGDEAQPVAKATASRDLACLRSALSRAVEWKLLESNPLMGLRNRSVASRKVVRYLSEDEERRLRAALASRDAYMAAARASANYWREQRGRVRYPEIGEGGFGDHLTPVVLLAMNTGLRRKELLTLQWADVDLAGRMLTVRASTAKSGKERHIPFNAEAWDALTRWQAQRGESVGDVFPVRDVKKAWANLLEGAEIVNFRFHDLRHHFASRLVRAGVDLNTVRELLGHADLKMTLRYAHLCPTALAAAVTKLVA